MSALLDMTSLGLDHTDVDALILCGAKIARQVLDSDGNLIGAECAPAPDLSNYAQAVLQAELNRCLVAVRAERDTRLAASDWTQLPDTDISEADRAAWATYRQALRDITGQVEPGVPVEWPAVPEAEA